MSSFKKLKVAFIGGGTDSVVGYTHKIAVEMDGKFEIVAGCFSQDLNTSQNTVDTWGLKDCRIYEAWTDLLEQEKGKTDVVIILTPTPTHKDIITAAIEKGYYVVSEKALCASSNEAREIESSLKQNDGYLAVTYNYSGYPILRELSKMIEQGKLGKITQVHVEMPQEGFAKINKKTNEPWVPQAWRLADQFVPTVSLDLGVHVHQLTDFLIHEEPQTIVATYNSYGALPGIVDDINCLAKYSNGVTVNIWYGKTALGYKNGLRLRVFGTKGAAEWYQMEPEYLTLADEYGHERQIDRSYQDLSEANMERYGRFKPGHPAGFIEAFANYYVDIYDDIMSFKSGDKSRNSYVFGIETALNGLLMLEAMTRSNQEGSWAVIDI